MMYRQVLSLLWLQAHVARNNIIYHVKTGKALLSFVVAFVALVGALLICGAVFVDDSYVPAREIGGRHYEV